MTIDNWQELLGRNVQIRKDGKLVRTGYVEAVTRLADVLWVESHGIHPRQLFDKAEGYTVEPLPF